MSRFGGALTFTMCQIDKHIAFVEINKSDDISVFRFEVSSIDIMKLCTPTQQIDILETHIYPCLYKSQSSPSAAPISCISY